MTEKEKHLEQIDLDQIIQKAVKRVQEEKSKAEEEEPISMLVNRMMEIARLRTFI